MSNSRNEIKNEKELLYRVGDPLDFVNPQSLSCQVNKRIPSFCDHERRRLVFIFRNIQVYRTFSVILGS